MKPGTKTSRNEDQEVVRWSDGSYRVTVVERGRETERETARERERQTENYEGRKKG